MRWAKESFWFQPLGRVYPPPTPAILVDLGKEWNQNQSWLQKGETPPSPPRNKKIQFHVYDFEVQGSKFGATIDQKMTLKSSQHGKASWHRFLKDFGGCAEASWDGKKCQDRTRQHRTRQGKDKTTQDFGRQRCRGGGFGAGGGGGGGGRGIARPSGVQTASLPRGWSVLMRLVCHPGRLLFSSFCSTQFLIDLGSVSLATCLRKSTKINQKSIQDAFHVDLTVCLISDRFLLATLKPRTHQRQHRFGIRC